MAVAEVSKSENSVPTPSTSMNPGGWIQRVRDYVDELKKEMRMVSWPTRDQVYSTTAVVIAAIFAFAAYFWVVDLAVSRAITKLFDTLTK